MVSAFIKGIKRYPERYYIVHYSSESIYDEGVDRGGMSPRITSIAVMHVPTRQTVSFSMHAIAEEKGIPKQGVEQHYDEIELAIIERFYVFVRDRREKYWIHWQMKNIVYGFEHIEHRFRTLTADKSISPPHIPVEVRINLDSVLREKYGDDYVPNRRMLNLMLLNGQRDHRFMTGEEEAAAFKAREFIRLHNSTISKVEFFRHVITLMLKGKLRTRGMELRVRIDRMMESQLARLAAFGITVVTVASLVVAAVTWLIRKFT